MNYRIEDQISQQAVDMNQVFERISGAAVIEGVEPSVTSGLEIEVTSGKVFVDGQEVEVSSQTVTLDSANPDNPRKDIITIDDTGSLNVYKGEAESRRPETEQRFFAQRPAPEDLQGIKEPPVVEVYLEAGMTSLTSDYILDRRVFADFVANELVLNKRPRTQDEAVTKLYSDAQFTLHETSVLLGPEESLTLDRFTVPSGRVISVTGANISQENGTGEIELFDHSTQETKLVVDSPELNVGDPLFEGSAGNDVELRLVNYSPDSSETLTAKVTYNIVDE